jgi:osmotically inducible lipoprotein OsmB
MRIFKAIIPLAAAGLLLSGCGHTLERRAATGALGGAAVGAVVDGGRGALIGGAAGAVGGAVLHETQKR